MIEPDPKIRELLAQGKHVEAARALLDAEDYERARELFEQVWDFRSAAECAEKSGDRVRALQNWLDAKALDESTRVGRLIADDGDAQERRDAALVYEKKHFAIDAAALYETLGENKKAAQLFQHGGAWLQAGRALEKSDELPAAGKLYERFLAEEPEGVPAASAHLALGKLLGRLGHHEQATRHLQDATRLFPKGTHESQRREARAKLIASLATLGLRSGASDVLRQARTDDPTLPPDLDTYLRAQDDVGPAAQGDVQGASMVGGRYRLEELVGEGGVGRVFRAYDLVTERDVALKLLHSATQNESYERFVREAKICGSVQHPNIVALIDFREDHGFFTMELLAGGTLRDRLKPRLLPAPAKRMALDIVDGLELAHSRGVVHRDIKPANIFFDATGTAKLGDFGVAHLIDLGRTQTGGLIGTVAYMSPEQITAAPISFAADHYSLGVTLFETLTGRLPFVGPDFVGQHLGETPPAPSTVHADLGDAWDALIARLLAKDPEARFADTHGLKAALTQIDTGEGKTVLVLGRKPSPSSEPAEPAETVDEQAATPRFHSHVDVGRTDISFLRRAVDTTLERTVILEQFIEGHPDSKTQARLLALGGNISPYVQHTLGFNGETRTFIFEAPQTTSIKAGALAPQQAVLLLMRTAQALASVHAANQAHGMIDRDHVCLDERGTPLLSTSGLGAPPRTANAQSDIDGLLAIAAHAIGSDDLLLGLRDHLLDETVAVARDAPVSSAAELLSLARLLHDGIVRCQRTMTHVAAMWQEADSPEKKTAARALAAKYGLSDAAVHDLWP